MGVKICLLYTSIRSSETFYNQFSTVPDVISSYSRERTVKTANIATYIFITFLSILFIICTGSILYFTSLIEIMENKEEYSYLSKLGYSKKIDVYKRQDVHCLLTKWVLVRH